MRGYGCAMARPPRLEIPDGTYHVSARGNERSSIYWDDGDRRHFLELLAEVGTGFCWRILAYCQMTNHYHLLIQTPEPNLAQGMRQLNGVYAQGFNRRHGRVGHLFQGRYSARLVQADEHLRVAVRYIVRNPVRAGLCREPQGWRWSGHRATLGVEPPWFLDTATLLAYYAPTLAQARERYRAHVEQESEGERSSHPLADGSDVFVASVLERLAPAPGIPRRYFRPPRPSLAELLGTGDADAIASAHDRGYSLREIARHLGVNASTVSRRLRRRRGASGTQHSGPDPALRVAGLSAPLDGFGG